MYNINRIYKVFENTTKLLNEKHKIDNYIGFQLICDIIIIQILNTKYHSDIKVSDFSSFVKLKKFYQNKFNHAFFMSNGTVVEDQIISKISWNIELMHLDIENLTNTQDLLGSILEKYVNRKKTGSFYTPLDVTNYMIKNAIFLTIFKKVSFLDRLVVIINDLVEKYNFLGSENLPNIILNDLSDIINYNLNLDNILPLIFYQLNYEDLKELYHIIINIKIIDPTCGSGSFLLAIFDYLYYLLKLINIRYELSSEKIVLSILNTLHGVDINTEAIMLLKMRIIIKMVSLNLENIIVDNILEHNFINEDALNGNDYIINNSPKGFDWRKFGYKFDCVIGNPPYIETRNIKNIEVSDFISLKCGNLYAMTLERGYNIATSDGILSFIVPLSLVTTRRMDIIRKHIIKKSKSLFFSHYADRPGSLFAGVHQRLTIFFSEIGDSNCDIYSTGYNYWNKEDRVNIFSELSFYKNEYLGTVKVGNSLENDIYMKIISHSGNIKSSLDSRYKLYVSSRLGLWAKSFISEQTSKEFFVLNFMDNESLYIANACINSSLFYFFWIATTDCWHVSKKDVINFLPNINKIDQKQKNDLIKLSSLLSKDIEKNKVFIGSKQIDYEYKHKYSKKIIDDIDKILSKVFKLTKEEYEYIINFALKYRMNDYYNEYIKELQL